MKESFLIILIIPIFVQALGLPMMENCSTPVKNHMSYIRIICSSDGNTFLSPPISMCAKAENNEDEENGDDDDDGFDRLWDVSSLG